MTIICDTPTEGELGEVAEPPVGVFFTPLKQVTWVLEKYQILDKWIDGATIFDPTAGEGRFLEGLIDLAIANGITVSSKMLDRLWANEKHLEFVRAFYTNIERKYGLEFPKSNFWHQDILWCDRALQVDIILGNPPWLNFNNLSDRYKEKIKPLFHYYGLVDNPKDLLLGGSRIDLAALIIAKSLREYLSPNGKAYFFMPLSILLNDGAGKGFRNYKIGNIDFCIQEIYDFKHNKIFANINTRYGLVTFERDRPQAFPIKYFINQTGPTNQTIPDEWRNCEATPLFNRNEPLTVFKDLASLKELQNYTKIPLTRISKPRQGINTCGANDIFIFDRLETITGKDDTLMIVSNHLVKEMLLPRQFLLPLIAKHNFQEEHPTPTKFILVPYNFLTGKICSQEELQRYADLWQYLCQYQTQLQNRKGSLIQSKVRKGFWYALLGVGPYTFAPYKVCWQAYGQKHFYPKLFGGNWQGNQALHAFIPLTSKEEGEKLVKQLSNPLVEKYLCSQQMEGTCNWAQPGRIQKLLQLV
ncbi:MAG: SAM-dependent DNA methyltransferase [Pseudanabaena sp. RU_4_16]|nr:SAM-dependent DNA methyltransferase [Pseudanabaena sp. RU_4_16]